MVPIRPKVLIKSRSARVRERIEDVAGFGNGKGARNQEMQTASRSWKNKGTDSPWALWTEHTTTDSWILSPSETGLELLYTRTIK